MQTMHLVLLICEGHAVLLPARILSQPLTRILSIGFKETFFLYFAIQKVITTTSGGVSMYISNRLCTLTE